MNRLVFGEAFPRTAQFDLLKHFSNFEVIPKFLTCSSFRPFVAGINMKLFPSFFACLVYLAVQTVGYPVRSKLNGSILDNRSVNQLSRTLIEY